MSRLIAFTPDCVPNRYGDRLQRRAVLVPLMGPIARSAARARRARDSERAAAVVARTQALIEAWRLRIDVLGRAGFAPLAGDSPTAERNRTFARNCRPTFFVPEQTARCCRRATICPFCWAREALATWQAIDHAFFASEPALTLARDAHRDCNVRARQGILPRSPGFDLIEWTVSWSRPHRIEDRETGQSWDLIHTYPARLVDWRQKNRWNPKLYRGWFETVYLATGREQWLVSIRRLIMVPTGYAVPASWGQPVEEFKYRCSIYRQPTRKDVLGAVARACRYPKSLLFGMDAQAVADLLNARSQSRLSARAGLFRAAPGSSDGPTSSPRVTE